MSRSREAYRRLPAHAAPPRPDVLLGDALPARASVRPAVHALYGFVRGADEIVDGPTPQPRERRAALDAWEAELERRAARAARSSHPVIAALVDAGAAPRPAARTSCAPTWARCASTARPVRIATRTSSTATWTARRDRRADHGAAARRAGGADAELARLGVAFQLTNFIRDVREDWALDRVYLPGLHEDDLARRRGDAPRCASTSPPGRAAPARCSRDADALAPRAAGPVRPGVRVARRGLPARARPRRAHRLRRLDAPAGAAAVGGGARAARHRGCAPMTVRATTRGAERTPLDGDARRRARLRRELRRPRRRARARGQRRRRARRRPLRDRRARDVRLRGADAVAARDGRRGLDPPGAPVHALHHAARHACATGCRGAGRRSTTASCATLLWAQCGRALRDREGRAAATPGRRRSVHTDRGDLTRAADRRRARLAPRAGRARTTSRPRRRSRAGWRSTRHDGSGDDLDVWIDRSLVRRGYAWRVPAGGEQRVGVGSYEPRAPRQGADRGAGRRGSTSTPSRYQGNWFPHRLRPRGRGRRVLRRRQRRPLLPAVGRGDPHRVLLRRSPRAASCARVARGRAAARGARCARYARVQRGHARAFALRAAPPAPDPGAAAARADARAARDGPPARSSTAPSAGTCDQAHPSFASGPARASRASRAVADISRAAPGSSPHGDRLRRARPRARAWSRTGARGEVLTLAYMNAEALARTRETGELHLWSRSRDELWHKGATSRQHQARARAALRLRRRRAARARRAGRARPATPASAPASTAASSSRRRRTRRCRRSSARSPTRAAERPEGSYTVDAARRPAADRREGAGGGRGGRPRRARGVRRARRRGGRRRPLPPGRAAAQPRARAGRRRARCSMAVAADADPPTGRRRRSTRSARSRASTT